MALNRRQRGLLVGILVGLCIIWMVRRPAPEDAPRPLQEILGDLQSSSVVTRNLAAQELRRVGTNAVPALLRVYDSPKPSRFRQVLEKIARTVHIPVSAPQTDLDRGRGLEALSILGPDAAAAVPRLMQEIRAGAKVSPRRVLGPDWRVIAVLGAIGKPAVAPLLAELKTNANPRVVSACISTFAQMGSAGEAAIPTLTNFLAAQYSPLATDALGKIGRHAETVVPLLAKMVVQTNPAPNLVALEAITRFGTNASLARSELLAVSGNYLPRFTIGVAQALLAAGETNSACGIADRVLKTGSPQDRCEAARLLFRLDLPVEQQHKLLERLASDTACEVRMCALEVAGKMDPSKNSEAITAAMLAILGKSTGEEVDAVLGELALTLRYVQDHEPAARAVFALQDGRQKRHFLENMINAGYVSYAVVRAALHDPSPGTRQVGVDCLQGIGKDARFMVDDLVLALDDPDPGVRWVALGVLQRSGETDLPSFSSWPRNSAKEAELIPKAKAWYERTHPRAK